MMRYVPMRNERSPRSRPRNSWPAWGSRSSSASASSTAAIRGQSRSSRAIRALRTRTTRATAQGVGRRAASSLRSSSSVMVSPRSSSPSPTSSAASSSWSERMSAVSSSASYSSIGMRTAAGWPFRVTRTCSRRSATSLRRRLRLLRNSRAGTVRVIHPEYAIAYTFAAYVAATCGAGDRTRGASSAADDNCIYRRRGGLASGTVASSG
jgi:hypothetical protein